MSVSNLTDTSKDISISTEINASGHNLDIFDKLSQPAPLYKLRTAPYDNTDQKDLWLVPESTAEELPPLTNAQIAATLDYFVMCSERLRQMNKTYRDIDAVSELLDEKEKDLELAARIGQSLLERNGDLQTRTEFLEEQLSLANECVTQLRHDMTVKANLLQSMAEHEDSGAITPDQIDVQLMQTKIMALENENTNLKLEASHLRILTQGLEKKEEQLVHDCLRQMDDANKKVAQLTIDLTKKNEECMSNQSQVNKLMKEVTTLQKKEKDANLENEELSIQLRAAQETQAGLAREILELQERYSDVLSMLNEAQDELKGHRRMANPPRCASPLADSLYDSLASELEASDSGFSTTPFPSARVFTARSIKEDIIDGSVSRTPVPCTIPPDPTGPISTSTPRTLTTPLATVANKEPGTVRPTTAICETPTKVLPCVQSTPTVLHDSGLPLDLSSLDVCSPDMVTTPVCFRKLSRAPSTESVASLANYPSPTLGEPGRPGTRDLEIALKKMNSRRIIELQYQQYRKSKGMSPVPAQPVTSLLQALYANKQEAEVVMKGISRPTLYKPFAGSRTLQQWRSLATAAVTSPLSPPSQTGICIKCSTDPQAKHMATAQMNTLQQAIDQDMPCSSTQILQQTSTSLDCYLASVPSLSTFSFVTSSVRHPCTDVISPTHTHKRLIQDSPRDFKQGGTCTYSSGVALAKVLKERSIKDKTRPRHDSNMTCKPSPSSHLGLRAVGLMMQSMYESNEQQQPSADEAGVVTRSDIIKQQSAMDRKESGV